MTTTTITAQENDLSYLDDHFDDPYSLKNWQSHHETEGWPDFTNRKEIRNEESVFYIEPTTTGWYGDFHRGPFYFKEIEGDFTVITKVKVSGLNSPSPRRGFSLAGLMVRAPRPVDVPKHAKGHENWMFLSTGSAKKKGKPQFETKNTVNGKSKLKVFPSRTGWIYLSISRIGSTFYQSYRYEGESDWSLLRIIERDEMPKKLQVGMLAYTDFWPLFKWFVVNNAKKFNTNPVNGKPDLMAKFDFMKFKRLDHPEKPKSGKMNFYNQSYSNREISDLKLDAVK